MKKEAAKQITPAVSLDKYHIAVNRDITNATVFWARVVSSENESLLTNYTKHTFFEIQYVLEGRIVITVGDAKCFTLDESDFIIIPPDTYHQIVDGDDTGARFIMAFSLEYTAGSPFEHLASATVAPRRESSALRAILSLILAKGGAESPLCAKALTALVECFLLELCEIVSPPAHAVPQHGGASTESKARIAAIRAYIKDYHGIGVTVGEVARRFGIGERHLNRIFRAEAGHTLRDEINHEKLCHIETLVASTTLSLGEISSLCGFSDEYAMNKFFKRYNRVKLSEYRRTARQ